MITLYSSQVVLIYKYMVCTCVCIIYIHTKRYYTPRGSGPHAVRSAGFIYLLIARPGASLDKATYVCMLQCVLSGNCMYKSSNLQLVTKRNEAYIA